MEAVILGLIQGISEFLPVSSTAHLILAEKIFAMNFPGLVLELFLHFASILAVIAYFFKELLNIAKGFFRYMFKGRKRYAIEFKLGLFLIISTAVTGLIGISLEGVLGTWIRGKNLMILGLVATGILLYIVEKNKLKINLTKEELKKKRVGDINIWDSMLIGVWQGIAVIPGISRSGATVLGALWRNLDKDSALSYSFFLAIPTILSSTLLKLEDIDAALLSKYPGETMVSFGAAFIFSLLGIKFLIYLVRQSKLTYFSLYLFLLAGTALALF